MKWNQLHSRKSHSNLWSQGGWTFNSFSSEVFSTLDEEKNQLEKHLAQVDPNTFLNDYFRFLYVKVPKVEKRLQEIKALIDQKKE